MRKASLNFILPELRTLLTINTRFTLGFFTHSNNWAKMCKILIVHQPHKSKNNGTGK
jgi:hypothetical protein